MSDDTVGNIERLVAALRNLSKVPELAAESKQALTTDDLPREQSLPPIFRAHNPPSLIDSDTSLLDKLLACLTKAKHASLRASRLRAAATALLTLLLIAVVLCLPISSIGKLFSTPLANSPLLVSGGRSPAASPCCPSSQSRDGSSPCCLASDEAAATVGTRKLTAIAKAERDRVKATAELSQAKEDEDDRLKSLNDKGESVARATAVKHPFVFGTALILALAVCVLVVLASIGPHPDRDCLVLLASCLPEAVTPSPSLLDEHPLAAWRNAMRSGSLAALIVDLAWRWYPIGGWDEPHLREVAEAIHQAVNDDMSALLDDTISVPEHSRFKQAAMDWVADIVARTFLRQLVQSRALDVVLQAESERRHNWLATFLRLANRFNKRPASAEAGGHQNGSGDLAKIAGLILALLLLPTLGGFLGSGFSNSELKQETKALFTSVQQMQFRFEVEAASGSGAKGNAGEVGLDGDQGAKGDPGPKGHTGLPGPDGDGGAKGDAGKKGTSGGNGTDGDLGTKGDSGKKGNPGAPGANGDDTATCKPCTSLTVPGGDILVPFTPHQDFANFVIAYKGAKPVDQAFQLELQTDENFHFWPPQPLRFKLSTCSSIKLDAPTGNQCIDRKPVSSSDVFAAEKPAYSFRLDADVSLDKLNAKHLYNLGYPRNVAVVRIHPRNATATGGA